MSQGPFESFVVRPGSHRERFANGHALAMAAQLAYRTDGGDEPTKPVNDQLNAWGFHEQGRIFIGWGADRQRVMKVRSADTQVYMARGRAFFLVCFRGTNRLTDWFTNVMYTQTPDGPFGKVHSGFLSAVNEPTEDGTVLEQVLAAVEAVAAESGLPVYVTGHSLGGACATLAAAYLHQRGVDVAGVYTYGCPRVGDAAFAREFDGALKPVTHRFIYGEDWVTGLPVTDYSHVGTGWLIRNGEVRESSDGPSADGQDFGLIGEVEDHAIQNYIDSLGNAARGD